MEIGADLCGEKLGTFDVKAIGQSVGYSTVIGLGYYIHEHQTQFFQGSN